MRLKIIFALFMAAIFSEQTNAYYSAEGYNWIYEANGCICGTIEYFPDTYEPTGGQYACMACARNPATYCPGSVNGITIYYSYTFQIGDSAGYGKTCKYCSSDGSYRFNDCPAAAACTTNSGCAPGTSASGTCSGTPTCTCECSCPSTGSDTSGSFSYVS
ncbi:MAG: hypothetical protein LBJ18_00095 [Rickettsiales bacterium]|nr:hypothetical protein [Rickettsiales bacterium]